MDIVRAIFGRHAAAPSSLGKRTRLNAAMARGNCQSILGRPRWRALRSPATVLAQPKASSIRFQHRPRQGKARPLLEVIVADDGIRAGTVQ